MAIALATDNSLEVIEMGYNNRDDSMSYFTVLFDKVTKTDTQSPSKTERMLATVFELNKEPCEDLVMIMRVVPFSDNIMIDHLYVEDPERALAKELCDLIKQEYKL